MQKITVAAVQMDCHLADKDKNLEKAALYIKQAKEQNAQLIVLPELFSTGYRTKDRDVELSETIPGPTTDWLIEKAKEYHVYIVGAILEYDNIKGFIFDTAVLIGPDGYIGKYRKTHLWGQEKMRFKKGASLPVFKTEIGVIGLQICYEVGFPEISRLLALHGAEIITCPSAFGKPRLHAWDIATQSRALENGVFFIASNRCSKDLDTEFAGNSRIVGPGGDIQSNIANKEGIVVSIINLDDITVKRNAIPYLKDYQTDFYLKAVKEDTK